MSQIPLCVVFLLASTLCLFAQPDPNDRKPPLELADYHWEKDAQERKLSPVEIDTLKTQGFVITDRTYRQVFDPYLTKTQVFVTTDSLINAYSVLLEDSIFRLERLNARRLDVFLRAAWKALNGVEQRHHGDQALLHAASERVRIMLGVALELSTGEKSQAPPATARIIDDEAQRVIDATAQNKPAWLGPPDSGFTRIDYTRFKPRGFYVGTPALRRYFRATAWLQAIPFRFDNDQEFAAFLLLYVTVNDSDNKDLFAAFEAINAMKDDYERLVGESDNVDLFGSHCGWPETNWDASLLVRVRQLFQISGSRINDQIASLGQDGKPERSFRLLSAHCLPDAILFSKTEDFRKTDFPSGLEVAAAMGSAQAGALCQSNSDVLLAKIESQKDLFTTGSLYNQFLGTLSVLLQPVDHAAPDLFRTHAWEQKSLQTFLGGWAQARHAWVLQAKQNVSTIGAAMSVPSGFVEPVPEFFNKMGQLSVQTVQTFVASGAYDNSIADAIEQLRATAAASRRYAELRKHDQAARPSEEDMNLLLSGWTLYVHENDLGKIGDQLEKLASRLETEGPGNDVELRRMLSYLNPSSQSKWSSFTLLCLKLEALSQKELHGSPLTEEDNWVAADYGEELAHIMFYEGNSYDQPRDDAPRIVDIYTNPNVGKVLHVGIGRPRQIYVLYPYGGKQILTHGAVFPYYEFPHAARLTDQAWISLLSSPAAPSQPPWLSHLGGSN